MSQLIASEKTSIKWVIVVRTPHEKGSLCPAFRDPNIYESYWISLKELTFLLEVEEQEHLSEASHILLTDVLKKLIEETRKEDDQDVIADMQSWVIAFKEAVNLVPEPEPGSELVDDFWHCRRLIHFLELHKGCTEKLVFEIMWGW